MSNVFSSSTVQNALELYRSMPAAVSMRGLTDFGFIVNSDGNETVDYVTRAQGIIKPGYWFITGGESKGRSTITAKNIADAVAKFQEHPFWAQLKVTTGKGFCVNGMVPELVDIADAETQVVFEVTHFGGRSLVPQLSVKLGKVTVEKLDWASGFIYTDERNNALKKGRNLVLSRILLADDFASEESLNRVWEEISTEVMRLMMFNTEDRLPREIEKSTDDRARVFVTQDLTALLPETNVDEKSGMQYVKRNDALSLQKSLYTGQINDDVEFASAMKDFMDEAMRVYTLYCRPLTDSQKQKAGRPTQVDTDLPDVKSISFERDDRRSTDKHEALIAWDGTRRSAPHFAYDGWNPEKGKTYRVIRHTWGRGIRVSPAPAYFVERFVQINETKAEKQLVRVEFDGAESVLSQEEIILASEKRFREGTSWISKADQDDGSFVIIQTWADYDELWREQVISVTSVDWRRVEMTPVVKTRQVKPEKIWLEPKGFYSSPLDSDWEKIQLVKNNWIIKLSGKDADGEEVIVTFDPESKGIAWNDIPKTLRAAHGKAWPVCNCRRARYEAEKHDKCRLCRTHITCTRCGNDSYIGEEKVNLGQSMCNSCVEKTQQEEWIMKHIGLKGLAKIRMRARRAFNADWLIVEETRYGASKTAGYLALPDGLYLYKSGFDDDQVKKYLIVKPSLDLVSWVKPLLGSQHFGLTEAHVISFAQKLDDFDFIEYARMTEDNYQLLKTQAESLLERAEKTREKAGWEKYREWENVLKYFPDVKSRYEACVELLEAIEAEIKPFEKQLEVANQMNVKIDAAIAEHHMNTCPLCDETLGNCDYHNNDQLDFVRWVVEYDTGGREYQAITPLARLTNERGEVVAEIRVHPGGSRASRTYGETYLVRFPSENSRTSDPVGAPAWDGEAFEELTYRKINLRKNVRSKKERQQIRTLRSQIAENNRQIEKLQDRAAREQECYVQAEEDFLLRPNEYNSSPIESGTLFSVEFVYNNEKSQWETDVFWDNASGRWVKLIVGQWEDDQPVASKEALVWVKSKNSDQLHLFSYKADNPEGPMGRGGRKVSVYGYLCQLVQSPEDLNKRIEALKQENETLQKELNDLENEDAPIEGLVEEATDEDGNPTTAFGQALQNAGFFDEDDE